jgi:hypothetical protein
MLVRIGRGISAALSRTIRVLWPLASEEDASFLLTEDGRLLSGE